ncbi:SPOR domain-containing protein [Desulfoluna sp.]|uniref:SPOR domain-containing protein n=1 Tax=Desulfoluna sp. TaxID=2045199 RepID=UPI002616308E|nr:SPOR domain-containing protein [Desulfoluna sp.]
MDAKEKKCVFIGAFAAIMPILANLVSIDAALITSSFKTTIMIGYVIKVIVLMILGGFIVYINTETDNKKAFQLGVMAPAIVIGMLNANNLKNAEDEINVLKKQDSKFESSQLYLSPDSELLSHKFTLTKCLSFCSTAYANTLIGQHGTPSKAKLIWYGISGNISNGWFVFVGSYKNKDDAKEQAASLRSKGYDAQVIEPFGSNKYYGVALGSYITLDEAEKLKTQALQDGLPEDTYLWKWKP